jgi:hypothetical protein
MIVFVFIYYYHDSILMVDFYPPGSYDEHIVSYWQGMLRKPKDQSPGLDDDGRRTDVSGNPVFLSCNIRGGTVTRNIGNISPDKSIFIPVNPVVISEPEANTSDVALLRKHAKEDEDSTSKVTLTIDEDTYDVKELQKHRCQNPVGPFEVEIPRNALDELKEGNWKAVADGYYVMIKPLGPGKHTIRFEAKVDYPYAQKPPWEQDVTYKFEVK